ncbi:molybdopterin-dependent oxidoreductase [Candidatus Bathyarchaeota archaeon]|nr:molybdopterin-dependent oxidoreductase [Candidatus Bathyarchaeota archaeon]MBS7630381.1 molybdopterin-dependent oxidoreductase [Candidatus Bathyarchaeota archaeon]
MQLEGNVERGFAESNVVVERELRTSRRYHNQLENKSVLVNPEPDGGVSL